LFIISSGGVELEQNLSADHDNANAPYLSIYARYAHIQPPYVLPNQNPEPVAEYYHGSSCGSVPPEDAFGGLVDQLIKEDLLPNSRFCRRRLVLTAGTWQESAIGTGN